MTDKEEIIFNDSPEAAYYKTDIEGWVSRHGHYYGKDGENTARYDGCTHYKCKTCQQPYSRNSYCKLCSERRETEKYLKYELKEWDGVTPLCIFNTETYFFYEGDLEDYCIDNEVKSEDLELVICEPNYAHEFDYNEYYNSDLPEDQYLEDRCSALAELFEKANEYIRKEMPILSWTQGNFRPIFKDKDAVCK